MTRKRQPVTGEELLSDELVEAARRWAREHVYGIVQEKAPIGRGDLLWIGMVITELQDIQREAVADRMRLLDVEKSQYRLCLNTGSEQSRNDRGIEEELVRQALVLEEKPVAYGDLVIRTKLGERLRPTLARLRRLGRVVVTGRRYTWKGG